MTSETDIQDIDKDVLPVLYTHLEQNMIDDCNVRMSKIFGKLFYGLQPFNLEEKHHDIFVSYFKVMECAYCLESLRE
jgi:hypothetical protein